MKPEEQRIAIAEACGWKQPFGPTGDWERPDGSMTRACRLPDYLNDLNAMHEAEKIIFALAKWDTYWERVIHVIFKTTETRYAGHATASQRAEAFLRTLNLWTDS